MSHQTQVHDRLRRALQSKSPFEEARQLAVDLVKDGKSADDVVKVFEDYRTVASMKGAEEDVLLDVMDLLVGWCRTEARILEQNSTT